MRFEIGKKSNLLIIVAIVASVVLSVAHALYIEDNLQKEPERSLRPWFIPRGDYFETTENLVYNHLYTDFQMVEFDPNSSNVLTIQGYDQARKYLNYYINSDTLFVLQTEENADTLLVNVENEPNLKVTVGSVSLKSATVARGGKVFHSLKPYGSDEEGIEVYHPGLWNNYALRNDKLLIIIDGGRADLLVEGGSFTFDLGGHSLDRRFPYVKLTGSLDSLNFINPTGGIDVDGSSLKTKNLIYKESPESKTSGVILIHCENNLEARLLHRTDIYYEGEPSLTKTESNYGRVLKINSRLSNLRNSGGFSPYAF